MTDDDKPVEFSLTLAEANVVLEALGNLPFVRVYQLIGKIQQQAERQVSGGAPVSTALQTLGEHTNSFQDHRSVP